MRCVLASVIFGFMSCSTGEHSGDAAPAAAGSTSGPQVDAGAERLASVSIDLTGAVRTVESPGSLLLQDPQGELRYMLTNQQYETIAALVKSAEFAAAMDDPTDCHAIPDGGTQRVTARWSDSGVQVDEAAASCFTSREESTHIYNRLRWALIDLQAQFLTCPFVGETGYSRELCRGCLSWGPSSCGGD